MVSPESMTAIHSSRSVASARCGGVPCWRWYPASTCIPKAPPSATIITGVVLLTMVNASSNRPCAPTMSPTPSPVTSRLSTAAVVLPSNKRTDDHEHADHDRRQLLDVLPRRLRGVVLDERPASVEGAARPGLFGGGPDLPEDSRSVREALGRAVPGQEHQERGSPTVRRHDVADRVGVGQCAPPDRLGVLDRLRHELVDDEHLLLDLDARKRGQRQHQPHAGDLGQLRVQRAELGDRVRLQHVVLAIFGQHPDQADLEHPEPLGDRIEGLHVRVIGRQERQHVVVVL